MGNSILIMIYYILIALLVIYFIWLYFKSKNDFFSQSRDVLEDKRQLLIKVLEDRGIDTEKDKIWLKSFDAFRDFPKIYPFDGETIVKDNDTIKGYPAAGGNHDKRYFDARYKGFWRYVVETSKADWLYGVEQRQLGINWFTAWGRALGVFLLKPIQIIIVACKGKLFKINTFQHYSENHPNQ